MRTDSTRSGWCLAFAEALVFGVLSAGEPAAWRPDQAAVFVAPGGKDVWSGRLAAPAADGTDGPFASIPRAQEAVRALLQKPDAGPVVVMLRGGRYELPEPVSFVPADSGSAQRPVVYTAYPGESPVLSGGTEVSAWTVLPDGSWRAPVPLTARSPRGFRRLYVGGLRRPLARSPNEGEYFRVLAPRVGMKHPQTGEDMETSKSAFRYRAGDVQPWPRLSEVNAVVLRCWESAILPIWQVDETSHTVLFTGPMKWPFEPGQRYYVEGFREALDSPGEWWHDREADMLYYRPKPGETPETTRVVVPRLTELLVLKGDPAVGQFVEHVRFHGLAFRDTDDEVEAAGHSDWQAAVTIPAALMADGANDIAFLGCDVRNIGRYGIWFRRGCRDCRVEHCEITDLGAGGVRIGEEGVRQVVAEQTSFCTVHNCFIHDGGSVYYGAIPVWIGQSSDNRVSHNEICDFNYTGISVGWSWGYHPTTCHRNTIAYNHLYELGRGVLYDMAAIYTLGISTGTVIHHNHIHDIWGFVEGYGAGGIYPDEGSSGILIENNLVYRTQSGGLTVHYGRDLVARNNIFAFGQRSQIHLGRADKESSQTLERNLIYYEEGTLINRLSALVSDYNLYWHTGGAETVAFPNGVDLAGWQKAGYDAHSRIADPLFVDPAQDDFRLRPGSPALALGFVPFDVSTAGLTGEPEWVAKPKAIPRVRRKLPAAEAAPPVAIRDDYEDSPVGSAPAFVTVHGATDGAAIAVSDRRAAAGKRSLRFVDVAGLKETWNPHLFCYPHLTAGTAVGEFDLWLGPGAVFSHEWRTQDDPYVAGPSLRIDAEGRLSASGKELLVVPREAWLHLRLGAPLGSAATGAWSLSVTLPGQAKEQTFELACPARFRACHWVVYVSDADGPAELFMDNLVLEARP